MKLYTYFRSSASYRVRIALNLKGIEAEMIPVNLLKGEQKSEEYAKLNPQQLLPALIVDSPSPAGGGSVEGGGTNTPPPDALSASPSPASRGGILLTQSLAIMEYLEDTHPQPPILPKDPAERARVRALALAIACEISPINNLKILKYLVGPLGVSDEAKKQWIHHWIAEGFTAIERSLKNSQRTGEFCHGSTPTMADCCLVPQLYNAKRFECDLAPYPTILRIAEHCEKHPAFIAAHPSQQPDAA